MHFRGENKRNNRSYRLKDSKENCIIGPPAKTLREKCDCDYKLCMNKGDKQGRHPIM